MPNTSKDFRRFLLISAVLVAVVDGILLTLERFVSVDAGGKFIDGASVALTFTAVFFLVMIIPKVKHEKFKRTVTLIAAGFGFQAVFMVTWIYYNYYSSLGRMPYVSIADFFYLGSYVLWTYATLPYLRRYGNLMGGNSRLLMAAYVIVAAIMITASVSYWYDAAQEFGYETFDTVVWLSYAVVPVVSLAFMFALVLLYAYEGYGKGLLRYYWLYFIVPIVVIVAGDIVNGFTYVVNENYDPGTLDDYLYLAAYAVTIAAGYLVLRSPLENISVVPVYEKLMIKDSLTEIVKGRGHIVEDADPDSSFKVFQALRTQAPNSPKQGYVLTRRNPTQVRAAYGLEGVPITWIASTAGDNVIDPTKPNLMAHSIMEFFSKTKDGVVLLEGIETIMVHNDFTRALRMLEQVNDFVMQYQSYLIVPIDPKAFGEQERAILERNFEILKPNV